MLDMQVSCTIQLVFCVSFLGLCQGYKSLTYICIAFLFHQFRLLGTTVFCSKFFPNSVCQFAKICGLPLQILHVLAVNLLRSPEPDQTDKFCGSGQHSSFSGKLWSLPIAVIIYIFSVLYSLLYVQLSHIFQ